jgi:hypothetical protein
METHTLAWLCVSGDRELTSCACKGLVAFYIRPSGRLFAFHRVNSQTSHGYTIHLADVEKSLKVLAIV